MALFLEHIDPGLAWLRSLGSEYLPSVDIALVTSVCTLLQVSLASHCHYTLLPLHPAVITPYSTLNS